MPALKDMGKQIFLDLKLHDIPNTAAQALKSCMRHGADIVNIHTQGGTEMMRACRKAVDEYEGVKPLLIGVTILTSLDDNHLQAYGINESAKDYVIKLAGLAQDAGLDGVVSSAQEAALIKEECGKYFLTITPGIRLPENNVGDQKRVVTPIDAAKGGSDYIVVGRPITESVDPRGTVQKIITMLESV
jgi:orotidine-5'-phosphate decarboxylase